MTRWITAAMLGFAYLLLLGAISDRDARIERLEMEKAVASQCVPVRPGELAAAQMMKDGTIECAITSGKSGNRATRYTYM